MSVITRLSITAVLFLLPFQVSAFGLSPSAKDLEINRGSTDIISILVENTSNQAHKYQVDLLEAQIGENVADITFSKIGSDDNILIKTDDIIDVPANDAKYLEITVTADRNSRPGVYVYGAVVSELGELNSGIGIEPALTSLIFITIPGEIDEDVEWIDFSASKSFYTDFSAQFYLTVRNNGEKIVQPTGTIIIESMFGNPVELISLNPNGSRTMSGQIRTYEGAWDSFFAIGYYSAQIEVRSWEGGETYNDEITFFILPIEQISIALVVLVILWLLVRRRKNRL